MVEMAEEYEVRQVCRATLDPVDEMVGGTLRRSPLAPRPLADAIAGIQHPSRGSRNDPPGSAHKSEAVARWPFGYVPRETLEQRAGRARAPVTAAAGRSLGP